MTSRQEHRASYSGITFDLVRWWSLSREDVKVFTKHSVQCSCVCFFCLFVSLAKYVSTSSVEERKILAFQARRFYWIRRSPRGPLEIRVFQKGSARIGLPVAFEEERERMPNSLWLSGFIKFSTVRGCLPISISIWKMLTCEQENLNHWAWLSPKQLYL